jgi:DNA-binding IclR family transcriptional regulator
MRDEPDNGNKHQIPVIDRMMEILDLLAMRSAGATISDLVERIVVPRTTIYRILNTLQAHGMVRRSPAGSYTLGPRLLALASRVSGDRPGYDLVALALPHLEQLSDVIGEASKVTVLDGDEALVLAAVNGNREYALTVTPGQKLPLHAGAASKILLASIPDADRTRILHASLARYTPKTIVDPRRLANELARVRRQGWAQDKGEFSPSVQAFAAPIIEVDSGVVGALSIPFLTGASPERQDEIKAAVLAAADAISAALPSGGKAGGRGDATPARSSLAAPKLRRRAAGLR